MWILIYTMETFPVRFSREINDCMLSLIMHKLKSPMFETLQKL